MFKLMNKEERQKLKDIRKEKIDKQRIAQLAYDLCEVLKNVESANTYHDTSGGLFGEYRRLFGWCYPESKIKTSLLKIVGNATKPKK